MTPFRAIRFAILGSWRRIDPAMTPHAPLRRALFALLAAAALLAPAATVPAAPSAAGAECGMTAGTCPLAAASACRTMECCVRPATPARPLPLEQAAPTAAPPQLVAPPPAAVALVAPPPPRPRPAADDRPLHGSALAVPLFTLHASFLI